MAGILDGVDKRTQLVGENRLELLLFRLKGEQLYGINVFKVKEVIRCPTLTSVPKSSNLVKGVAKLRGHTIPVIDLGLAMGMAPIEQTDGAFVIIADYNRNTQGFLVDGVERIVNMNWEEILPPPKGSGRSTFLTAVTRVNEKLVEIIDVEKVLSDVVGSEEKVSSELVEEANEKPLESEMKILVADDSAVARKQIQRTMDQVGVECIMVKDGKEALDFLKKQADENKDIISQIPLVISDIEMPNMDGYTLTTEIRKDPRLSQLYVVLHTSLSGVFNQSLVEKVTADKFIAKFDADELAETVLDVVNDTAKIRQAS